MIAGGYFTCSIKDANDKTIRKYIKNNYLCEGSLL